jgi:transcription antitermination factor NusG
MNSLRESEMASSTLISRSFRLEGNERWYVAMTQPTKENFAAENLANQGFRCFVPRHLVTYRHARRIRTQLAPMFPQYLFVILDPTQQRWRAVNGTFGVRRLINNGEDPVPVCRGVVETLVASCNPSGVLVFQPCALKPGDRIKLVAGPFAGAFGSLQSLDASGRVRLLLEIMCGKITASTDVAAVSLESSDA